MTNGWTAKCEECGKLIGDLAYERKGKLLCRRCAYKQDGKHIEKSGDD
jgi:formylmethanofuran dehydrogenase subunit E